MWKTSIISVEGRTLSGIECFYGTSYHLKYPLPQKRDKRPRLKVTFEEYFIPIEKEIKAG